MKKEKVGFDVEKRKQAKAKKHEIVKCMLGEFMAQRTLYLDLTFY